MSAILDKLYSDAQEVFGIDGIGAVIYPNRAGWMDLITLWKGRADTQLAKFATDEDWQSLTRSTAQSAESDMLTIIQSTASDVLGWIKQNLLGEDVANVSSSTLKTFIMAQYAKSAVSLQLHVNGSMQDAIDDETITEAEARSNLDQAVRVMEMLALAGEKGMFDSLPRVAASTNGIGVAPVVVAIVAVVVAGLIVALYYIYRTTAMTERIAMAALGRCDKLFDAGQYEAYSACIKGVQQNVPGSDLMKPINDAAKIIGFGVAAAALLWVGVKFVLPALERSSANAGRA